MRLLKGRFDAQQRNRANRAEQLIERRSAHTRANDKERLPIQPTPLEDRHDVRMPERNESFRIGFDLEQIDLAAVGLCGNGRDRHVARELEMAREIRDRAACSVQLGQDLVVAVEPREQ